MNVCVTMSYHFAANGIIKHLNWLYQVVSNLNTLKDKFQTIDNMLCLNVIMLDQMIDSTKIKLLKPKFPFCFMIRRIIFYGIVIFDIYLPTAPSPTTTHFIACILMLQKFAIYSLSCLLLSPVFLNRLQKLYRLACIVYHTHT